MELASLTSMQSLNDDMARWDFEEENVSLHKFTRKKPAMRWRPTSSYIFFPPRQEKQTKFHSQENLKYFLSNLFENEMTIAKERNVTRQRNVY